MAFPQAILSRFALASGPIGSKRLLYGALIGGVAIVFTGVVWMEVNRFQAPASRLQKLHDAQNGTGLSGVDNDPLRHDEIQRQEAKEAALAPYPGTVSIPSIESSWLDQQRARRESVAAENHPIRTAPNKTAAAPAAPVPVDRGRMLGYVVAMNAAMAAMTNEGHTTENFRNADIEKWQPDALKAAAQVNGKDGAAGDRTSQTPKHCLGLGGLKVMAQPKLAAKMEPDSPQTPAEVEMTTGPLTGYRIAGEVQKHGDTLTVGLNTLYYDGQEVPVDAIVVSPLTQEPTVASDVDEHIPARIGGPAITGALQGLGQAAQLSGSTVAAGPFGGAATYAQFNPWQIGGMMAGGAASGAQSVMRDLLPKGSTVTLSTQDAVAVLFKKDVCLPN